MRNLITSLLCLCSICTTVADDLLATPNGTIVALSNGQLLGFVLPVPLHEDLIMEWLFNEKTNDAGQVVDTTGNNPGSYGAGASAPTYVATNYNSFDGGDKIDGTNEATFDFGTGMAFSVSIWGFDTQSGSSSGILIGKQQSSSPFLGWKLWNDEGGGNVVKGLLQTGPGVGLQVTTSTIGLNEWIHYFLVYDGNFGLLVYTNAVLDTTTNLTTQDADILNDEQIVVGNRAALNQGFVGSLDEPTVYTDALTPAEVTNRYNESVGPPL